MASVRVLVKLKYEGETAAFYDISGRVDYENLSWESNSEGTSANARVPVWTILPKSSTEVSGYAGATFAEKLNAAIADESFLIEIPNRAEIRIVDVETSPDTALFAGIITRISSNRQGGSIIQDVECADNTAILEEHVVADYYAPRDSRDIDVIYGGTTTYTSSASLPSVVGQIDGLSLSSESTGGNLSDGTYEVRAQARNSTMTGRDSATPQYGPVTKAVSLALSAGTGTQRLKIKWKNPGSADSVRIYVKRTSASGSGTQNVEYLGKTANTLTSQKTITAATRTSNVVEITTSSAHGLSVEDPIVVSIPQTPGFSVAQTDFALVKAVPNSTKITYDSVGDDGSATITGAYLTSGGSALVGSLSTVESPTVLTSSSARGWADGEIYTAGGNNYRLGVGADNVRGWLYPISVFGGLFDNSWVSEIGLDTSTYVEAVDTQYRFSPYFQESDTPNAEQYGGRTIRNILDYISEKTGAEYWVDKGSFDGAGSYSSNLHYRAKTPKELVENGLYDGSLDGWTTSSGFALGASTSGPYGAGYTVSSSTSSTSISTASGSRIPVVQNEKYFISVRAKASDSVNRMDAHYAIYNVSGTEISRHSIGDLSSVGEWERLWKIVNVSSASAAYIGLVGECITGYAGSVSFTDWSVIKITGAMGYGDFEDLNTYTIPIYEMEVPSSPVESGNTANRLHLYAVFRTRDSSGNKVALTDTSGNPVQYVDYDFVPGIWATNGKIVEAAITDERVETLADAELSAEGYWKENGLPIESYTFEMRPRSASDSVYPVPEVGDVIPFIWNTMEIAKPMIVKSVAAKMLGMDIVYTITVGGDVRLQRSAFIRLSERIREIDDVNPVPPTPDIPSDLTVSANDKSVAVSWSFDETREVNKKLASFEIQRQDAIFRAISEISRSGSTVTVTTAVNHGLVVSDVIRIDLEPTATNIMALEGQWSVASTTTTSFTFASLTSGTISTTSVSGYVYYNFTDFRTVQNTKATYVNDGGLTNALQYRYKVRSLSSDLTASSFTEVSSPTEPNEPTVTVADGSITAEKLVSSLKAIEIFSGPTLPTLPSASYTEGTIVYHLGGTPPGLRKVGVGGAWENAIGSSDVVANSITAGLISTAGLDASVIKSGALVIDSRFGVGNLRDVSHKAQSGTTATLTTTANHGYSSGNSVKITEVGAPFNGTFTILASPAPTATKFSYTVGTSATVAETEVLPYGASLVNSGTNAITSTYFTVSNTGQITATSANISGAITATSGSFTGEITAGSGTIGGFDINASSLTAGSGSSAVGMAPGTFPFFAGNATAASAPFRVSAAGAVTASSVTITGGSITGTSLNITAAATFQNRSSDGTLSPAVVTKGDGTQGDVAAASGGILHLGATSAASAGAGGTFTSRLQLENGFANFRGSVVEAKQFDVFESDADVSSGTRRGTIRGSATVAGRIVVENTAGSGNATLYVDGSIEAVSGGSITGNGFLRTNDVYTADLVGETYANVGGVNGMYVASGGATAIRRTSLTASSEVLQLVRGWTGSNSSTVRVIQFARDSGNTGSDLVATRGGINIGASGTTPTFFSTSDYRLKSNIRNAEEEIDFTYIIKNIQPRLYTYMDSDENVLGFVAHELQPHIPIAVTGYKDQVDEKGDPVYQEVMAGNTLIYVIGALREAIKKIDLLESRVAELEG